MAPGNQLPAAPVSTRQGQGEIAGMIDVMLETEASSLGRDPIMGTLLAQTIGVPGDPGAVTVVVVQRTEQAGRQLQVRGWFAHSKYQGDPGPARGRNQAPRRSPRRHGA